MSEKKDFVESVRQKLEDWDYQRDRLVARIDDLSHEWREEAEEKLADFKEQRKDLEAKLDVLESRSEDAWQDIKDGIELAWDGLKTGLLAARSEFEDKKKD
ncbi:MAG: hypothetical protein VX379_01870 [Pseudomonadota bacterium]|uniref:hypothetical protein n=1 Tax=Alcanivorax sp. TaxID=1872427 RepID=UPI0025C6CC73|nr:hypothetical protein [Alcanivorax sp.]MED5238310.1 hypothetical protein [Pseudomonadota bacterium]MEE3320156.1 hypothetical protein [Pseudomonadota bacterium]